jgi:hypothetical protein
MKSVRIIVPVVLGLMACSLLLGCGSQAPSSDGGTSSPRIYFVSWGASHETGILSTYSNGGGKQAVVALSSPATMYTSVTHESVILSPDRSVLLDQYKCPTASGKDCFGLMDPSGDPVLYDFWPMTSAVEFQAYNPSFALNSDITCITGEGGSYYLNYASNESSYAKSNCIALCPASAESHPSLSKSSSYDAFEMLDNIWVKGVGTTDAAVDITNSVTTIESHPAFSPITEKKIAFICREGSNRYVAKMDDCFSGSIYKLSTDFTSILPPLIWSDDGAYIYYIASSGSGFDLYKYNVNTDNQSLVLNHPGAGSYLDLKKLPGSSRLFYVLLASGATGEIWSVDPASGATLEVYSDGNLNFFDYSNLP